MPPALRGEVTLRAAIPCSFKLNAQHSGAVLSPLSNVRGPWTIWQYKPEAFQFCRPFDPVILLLGISFKELIWQIQINNKYKFISFFSFFATPLLKT